LILSGRGGRASWQTLHRMFGSKGNPIATSPFNIIACLQEHEGVRLQVVA